MKDDVTRFAAALGAIQGDIGVSQQNVRALMAGIAERNSDADGYDEVAAANIERAHELLLDTFSHLHSVPLVGELQQDDEFVAAKSPDRVVAAHAGL